MIQERLQSEQHTPEWMDLKSLQRYADVSERTLREWIHRSENPLPASRVGSKILVRRSAFDRWLSEHQISPVDISGMVKEIMSGIAGSN